MSKGRIEYGRDKVAVAGLVVGGGIAIGVPALVLSLGEGLDSGVLTALVVLPMVCGVLLGVVSVVFGISVPSSIRDGDDDGPKENGQEVVEVGPAADEPETPAPDDQTVTEQP